MVKIDENKCTACGGCIDLCPLCYMSLAPYCQGYGLAPVSIIDLCRMALGELPSSPRS